MVGRWMLVAAIVLAGCGSSVPSSATGSSSTAATTSATTTIAPSTSTTTSTTTTSTTAAPTDPDAAALFELTGRQFQGDGPAAPVRLRLDEGGTLHASYGCNSGDGTADVVDGRLVVGTLSVTAMGCPPAVMQQEDAVLELLQSRPTITIEGTTLVLTGTTLTLRLDEQVAVALIGTRWTTNGSFTAQAATFAGLRQGFVLAADGTWTYEGCGGTATGGATVDGNVIAFTMTSPAPPPCAAGAAQATEEQHLIAMLQGTATFQITERSLRLTGPDGTGEMFRAER